MILGCFHLIRGKDNRIEERTYRSLSIGCSFAQTIFYSKFHKFIGFVPPLSRVLPLRSQINSYPWLMMRWRTEKNKRLNLTQEIKQYGGHREKDAKTLLFMYSWVFWLKKGEGDFPLLDKIFPFLSSQGGFKKAHVCLPPKVWHATAQSLQFKRILFFLPKP